MPRPFGCGVLLIFACTLCSAFAWQARILALYPESQMQGHHLYLRGDGLCLSWASGQVFEREAPDHFVLTLSFDASAAGQTVRMKCLVNDADWQVGSNDEVTLPNSDVNITLYPWFYSSAGHYFVVNDIYSPQLGNSRSMVIYLPPSYEENKYKPYELLIMHDGQNVFNDSTSFLGISWRCAATIDSLVVQGRMREIIVAGPYNTADRMAEYTYSRDPSQPDCCKGDRYLDFLAATVVPFMRQQYRLVPGPVGVLGSSLGGLISCYAGWTRPETFRLVGCMSSSFWCAGFDCATVMAGWNNEDFNRTIIPSYAVPRESIFYLDSGDSGPDNDDMRQTQTVTQHLATVGLVPNRSLFYYLDHGGQHSELYWGKRFWVPMTSLYPAPGT